MAILRCEGYYFGNKKNRIWMAYALDRRSKEIAAIRVGKRSKRTVKPLIDTLVLAFASHIRTDALPLYKSLIPEKLHRLKRAGTNGIERMDLTRRTHLKRLNRRTLCYSKSAAMLEACVKIYCWG